MRKLPPPVSVPEKDSRGARSDKAPELGAEESLALADLYGLCLGSVRLQPIPGPPGRLQLQLRGWDLDLPYSVPGLGICMPCPSADAAPDQSTAELPLGTGLVDGGTDDGRSPESAPAPIRFFQGAHHKW